MVRVKGWRYAVYRDPHGTVRAVIRRLHPSRLSGGIQRGGDPWEGPCHGSRFGVDDTVLQGPAVRPLEEMDVVDGGVV